MPSRTSHIRVVRRTLILACLGSLLAVTHAQTPPEKSAVKVTGYKVSVEGGEEGTVTYRYDEHGKPIDGRPRPPGDARTAEKSKPGTEVTSAGGEAAEIAPLRRSTGPMRSADGRELPFQLSGNNGVKTVDESVDADSALRKLTATNDLLSRRYETGQVDLRLDERFSTSGNRLTLNTWTGKASAIGEQRADIELRDTLGGEVRPNNLVEVKALERPTSPWARRIARPAGWDERLGGTSEVADRRVDRDELSTMGTRANAFPRNPGSIERLSMQDINRYQFRRTRSTEPGLPVAKPGSERIEKP